MRDFNKIELAAAKGREIPECLDVIEQLAFHNFSMIYHNLRQGIYTREFAKDCKDKLMKELEVLTLQYDFGLHCYEASAERYKNTEIARANYRKNRTLENADKLVNVFEGLEELN